MDNEYKLFRELSIGDIICRRDKLLKLIENASSLISNSDLREMLCECYYLDEKIKRFDNEYRRL
jgi:hypothetical protein